MSSMLGYGAAQSIALDVLKELNIPEDIEDTFNNDSAYEFEKQYIFNDDYIEALVDIELQKYDTSDNSPAEIEDIRENAIEIVREELSGILESYYQKQQAIAESVYSQIAQLIANSAIDDVVDVDIEFEKADPDVGMYDDERRIVVTLSTGTIIIFDVKFED